MSLWLSERKTAGLWAGGLWRSQQGSQYAFNLDLSTFKDTVTGQSLSCNIDGTRYDEVDGVTTAFGTDVPTIADNGLRICGAYSNHIPHSNNLTNWTNEAGVEVTQVDSETWRITTQPTVGSYQNTITVFLLGTPIIITTYVKSETIEGQIRIQDPNGYSGISSVVNVTTEWTIFKLKGTITSNNRKSGIWYRNLMGGLSSFLIKKPIVSSKKYAMPYIPTTTYVVSSPSEAGNSGTGTGIWIDDVATNFPLLNTALTSQGTLTFKWKTGFNDADVSGNLNILSFNGTTDSAISYDADNNLIKITDGTNTASKALTVVADTEYTIQATWGLVSGSPKMQIAVNGTAGIQATFAGTFTPSDIYFGLENEELQYVKDMTVYKVATWL